MKTTSPFDFRSIAIGIFVSVIFYCILSKVFDLTPAQTQTVITCLGLVLVLISLISHIISDIRHLKSLYNNEKYKTERYDYWISVFEAIRSEMNDVLALPSGEEKDKRIDEVLKKYERINSEYKTFKENMRYVNQCN